MSETFDPNPGVGKVPLFDKVRAVLAVFCVPWVFLQFAVRRVSEIGKDNIPFTSDLIRSMARGFVAYPND